MARKTEVKETGYPGIKQRLGDGKYVVTIDLGRDPVTKRQRKTTKIVNTLKEAKALRGKNDKEKQYRKRTGVTGKVFLADVIDDYMEVNRHKWSDSYITQKNSENKRIKAYFGAKADIREIDTLDIEKFFNWCKEEHKDFPQKLTTNTIQKIKTHLKDVWRFARKNPNRYGQVPDAVTDADYGEIEHYEAIFLSIEQVNYWLRYTLVNERDFACLTMFVLGCLCGLRRGEICGLQWKDVLWDKDLIDVRQQKHQVIGGSVYSVPKHGKEDGTTRQERKQRYAALPEAARICLQYAKAQQEEFLNRPVTGEDYVFVTKTNLVNHYLPNPGKVSQWFRRYENRMNKVRRLAGLEEIPNIRLHDLRHTFISLTINNGCSIVHVGDNCGHTFRSKGSPVTLSVYRHADIYPDDAREHRKDIMEYWKKAITVSLEIPDMSGAVKRNGDT